jgi:Zn-dependent peptidase ImmA (M78 family)/DNA-binding XRE family transcriptional regulator
MICGARIVQAREFAQMTQTQLADALGMKQAAIAHFECGRVQPTKEIAEKLATALGFSPLFFERSVSQHFAVGSLEFRARASLSAKEKKHAYQYAHLVFEIAHSMAVRLSMPATHLPRLKGKPENCAAFMRSELGLNPEGPIDNLTDVLERAGVLVFALPPLYEGAFERLDGFSTWASAHNQLIPSIFVSTRIPGDRQRLTIAHEIGELAIADMPPGREREKTANRFAGAFLMPAAGFVGELAPPLSIYDFVEIKRRYRVSIQAALVRARHLGIIDERRYHALFQQLSARGWRRREPVNFAVPNEKPRALHKMAELLYGTPIDFVRLGTDCTLDPLFLRTLFSAHASLMDLSTQSSRPGSIVSFPSGATQRPEHQDRDLEEL